MNKTELIDAMAADAGITKAAAKKALESFLGNVEGTLKKGDRVSLVGFGSWSKPNEEKLKTITKYTQKQLKQKFTYQTHS